ncbi:MAG TPA: site-specific integrase [Candidatus Binatia bacterium]|jgi:integrase|nr:site-specific integrase [Candidatus Binatia bacterium]
MGLYKRNDTWVIQYFAHGKRVREAIGPSKRQAELVLAKRKADIREGRYFAPTEKPLAFSILADRYLKEHAALHKKPRSYLRNVASAKVLKAFFGERLLKDITPADVHAFIMSRKEQGKSAATINAEVGHLSHMFTWANKLHLTTHHPCRGVTRLKANQKDRYLTREEIDRLLAVCRRDLRDMVILGLGTGMRASEVLSLDREQVELKRKVAILPDTKNGDRRIVPLPEEVIAMFQRRPIPLGKWFAGGLGNLTKGVRRAAKRANLPGVTFHTLRHTFASHAVMSGVDLYTVAKLLGHRTLQMTQRYAHLAPAHLHAATEQAARSIFAADVPQNVSHAAVHSLQPLESPEENEAVA